MRIPLRERKLAYRTSKKGDGFVAGQSLQSSRFEYKYYVTEAQAADITTFIKPYLEPDEFLLRFGGIGYPVCSLYLDNSGLLLYDQTIQGQKNRFKLRIRFYDDDPANPAFLEIKRRETDVIKKKRCAVSREGARLILAGEPPEPSFLHGKASMKALDAMHEFCNLRDRISAQGCTFVYYHRQAYVSVANNFARVTFDRQLEGGVYNPGDPLAIPKESKLPPLDGVVLELKFTDKFPLWMTELSDVFSLQRTSVPKYVKCVEELGIRDLPERNLSAHFGADGKLRSK